MPEPDDIAARAHAQMLEHQALFRADPWYAIERGWVITQDEHPPEGVPAVRPFPAKDSLRATMVMMLTEQRGMMAKTRQLMITWLVAWLLLWDAITVEGRLNIIQGKRLDDVMAKGQKSVLGRIRFMRKHLPAFLQPEVLEENMTSESYANGSTIEALPEGGAVVRSRTPSRMLMDEVCFHESGESNWNAANPAAGWLWAVSTPNGHEFLWRQADRDRPWDDWRSWPKLRAGLHGYKSKNGIMLAFLSWESEPERCTPEAAESRRKGYTSERDFMREQMGSFSIYAGVGVYSNEFREDTHVIAKYVPNPMAPIVRGWDFGYNGQAVGFYQMNALGQLVWFDLIILKHVGLPVVAQEAVRRMGVYHSVTKQRKFIGADGQGTIIGPVVNDYGDPAGEAHDAQGETVAAVLSRHDIHVRSKPTTGRKKHLVEQVRMLLMPRSDGTPGILLARNSPEMEHAIAGFNGGYHWGPPKEGRAEKEVPHKDGFYDHIFDQLQYAVDHVAPLRPAWKEDSPQGNIWWREESIGVGNEVDLPYGIDPRSTPF